MTLYTEMFFVPDAGKHQNILFVYDSSYPSHIENIYKFKQFLEEECYVTTKLDLIDIPQTESMVCVVFWF